MNRFIQISSVVCLALIMLVRMMAMPISLMEFTMNKQFISAKLCENRLSPEMKCGGKCFLKKQFSKSNDSQESQNRKGGNKSSIVDYCEPFEKYSFGYNAKASLALFVFSATDIRSSFERNLFRPPIA